MLESRIYLSGAYPSAGTVFPRARVYPIYGDDVQISKARETDERYFRETLEGTFTFQNEAYSAIRSNNLNVVWTIEVVLYDTVAGTEQTFGKGTFTKDKCSFDDDDHTCSVEIATVDRYSKLLAHLEDSFNLVKIAPEINQVTMKKRAILQLYMIGDSKITNIMGNISFEVDSLEVTEEEKIIGTGNTDYHFSDISSTTDRYINFTAWPEFIPARFGDLTQLRSYVEDTYFAEFEGDRPEGDFYYYNATRTRKIKATWEDGLGIWSFAFVDNDDNVLFFGNHFSTRWFFTRESLEKASSPTFFLLLEDDVEGEAIGLAAVSRRKKIYARLLLDVNDGDEIPENVYKRASEDITESNPNYRYVRPITVINGVYLSSRIIESSATQASPTKYGVDGYGNYFVRPDATVVFGHVLPVAWNQWVPNSFWFESDPTITYGVSNFDCKFVLKDAYLLKNCIERILEKMDIGITLGYSTFLESTSNPISYVNQKIYITPITNVKKTYYKQAAQRGDISLKSILDMLKTMFKCYWYINSQNQLIIEHISWFKNGNSYQADRRSILLNTTNIVSPRNRKPWSFGQNKFKYDTERLPRRYEFKWPNDATEPFNGVPIEVDQAFLENNGTETNTVSGFFSDLDLIVSQPESIGDDLFAVIAAREGVVPIVEQKHYESASENYMAYLQNGWLSFDFLFRYYLYDLSGGPLVPSYEGSWRYPESRARAKVQEAVEFPYNVELFGREGLIKTGLGDGEIKKISLNLSSLMAKADLEYDTE